MEKKRLSTAYLWWALLGLFGGHRFYPGQLGSGLLFLCTFGFFVVGWVIDFFMLPEFLRSHNRRVEFLREPMDPGSAGAPTRSAGVLTRPGW